MSKQRQGDDFSGAPIRQTDHDHIVLTPRNMEPGKLYLFSFQGARMLAAKTGDDSCDVFEVARGVVTDPAQE